MVLEGFATVPCTYVDVAASPERFNLSGAQRAWNTASPDRPVATILESPVGDPAVFLEETEKGGTLHDPKG